MTLENLKLKIIEDRPPVNITSPGTVPINLQIGKMQIKRDDGGVFQIQPNESDGSPLNKISILDDSLVKKKERDRELISLQLVMQQLKLDNDRLKKEMNHTEKENELHRLVSHFIFDYLLILNFPIYNNYDKFINRS